MHYKNITVPALADGSLGAPTSMLEFEHGGSVTVHLPAVAKAGDGVRFYGGNIGTATSIAQLVQLGEIAPTDGDSRKPSAPFGVPFLYLYAVRTAIATTGPLVAVVAGQSASTLPEPAYVSVTRYGADPTGVGSSYAAFQTALDDLAGTGVALFVPAGRYLIDATVNVPSFSRADFGPGAVVQGATAGVPVFSATSTAGSGATTLGADAVAGSDQIIVHVPIEPGQWIVLVSPSTAVRYSYFVKNASGTRLTLDRPVYWPFKANMAVIPLEYFPSNIELNFAAGAGMSGTCSELISFVDGQHVSVIGGEYNVALGAPSEAFVLCLGCMHASLVNLTCDAAGVVPACTRLFACEDSHRIGGFFAGSTGGACPIDDCSFCSDQNVQFFNCKSGFMQAGNEPEGGCFKCWILGGSATGCENGLVLTHNAQDPSVSNVLLQGGTYGALLFNDGVGCPVNPQLTNVTATGNAIYGLKIDSGTVGTRGAVLNLSDNGVAGLQAEAEFDLEGLLIEKSQAAPAGGVSLSAGSYRASIRGMKISSYVVNVGAGVELAVSDSEVIVPTVSYGFNVDGVLRVSRTTVRELVPGCTGINASGSVYLETGYDASGCTNPLFLNPGAVAAIVQGGVPPAAVTASGALPLLQHYASAIELASGAAADATVTTYPIAGLQFTARNLSSRALIIQTATPGDPGVTVAAGKTAIVAVGASDAKMSRVTNDA